MKSTLFTIFFLSVTIKLLANIEKVEFTASRCMGPCPNFKLEINADRSAKLNALEFNDIEGEFNAIIDSKNYNELIKLLKDMNFNNLNDHYTVKGLDSPTYFLTITFDNGKKKSIKDYGGRGSNNLIKVYNKLFELRKNQVWKRIESR